MNKKRLLTLMGGTQKSSLLNGLVAYWKLDESSDGSAAVTRVDSLGISNLTDASPYCESAAGKVGNGCKFVLANAEFLYALDSDVLSMGNYDFTFSCWLKIASKPAAQMYVINKYSGSREYALYYNNTLDRFDFKVSSDGGFTNIATCGTAEFNPDLDTWYFILVYHDATNDKIGIQVNNGTANTAAWSLGVFSGTSDFLIGSSQTIVSPTQPFDGAIDEIGVWKRLLTASEKSILYNSGNGITHPFS